VHDDDLHKAFRETAGGSSKMTSSSVGTLARNMGFAPSQRNVKDFETKCGAECDEAQVKEFLVSLSHTEDKLSDLTKLFKQFDKAGDGKVTKKVLLHILSSIGEPLSAEEIDEISRDLFGDADPVDYNVFIMKVLQS